MKEQQLISLLTAEAKGYLSVPEGHVFTVIPLEKGFLYETKAKLRNGDEYYIRFLDDGETIVLLEYWPLAEI